MDSRSHPRISGSYHQEVFRPRKDQKTNQTIADWLRQGSQGCFTGWQHCQRKPARSLMSRVTFRSETKSSLQCPRQVQLARQRSLQDKRRERQVRPAICANTRWHRLHRLHLHTAVWQSTPSSRHWFVERCMQRQGSSRYDYQGKSTWWRWLELLQRRVGNKGNQRNARHKGHPRNQSLGRHKGHPRNQSLGRHKGHPRNQSLGRHKGHPRNQSHRKAQRPPKEPRSHILQMVLKEPKLRKARKPRRVSRPHQKLQVPRPRRNQVSDWSKQCEHFFDGLSFSS